MSATVILNIVHMGTALPWLKQSIGKSGNANQVLETVFLVRQIVIDPERAARRKALGARMACSVVLA